MSKMVEPKTVKDDKVKTKAAEPTAGLGLARIKKIMKGTADTGNINQEGLFVTTKATEMFIQYLAKSAHKVAKSNAITYEHLAKLVNDEDHLEFLQQIIPEKITVKEFKEIIAKGDGSSTSDDDESDSEDSEQDDVDSNKKSNKPGSSKPRK